MILEINSYTSDSRLDQVMVRAFPRLRDLQERAEAIAVSHSDYKKVVLLLTDNSPGYYKPNVTVGELVLVEVGIDPAVFPKSVFQRPDD